MLIKIIYLNKTYTVETLFFFFWSSYVLYSRVCVWNYHYIIFDSLCQKKKEFFSEQIWSNIFPSFHRVDLKQFGIGWRMVETKQLIGEFV